MLKLFRAVRRNNRRVQWEKLGYSAGAAKASELTAKAFKLKAWKVRIGWDPTYRTGLKRARYERLLNYARKHYPTPKCGS